MVNLQKWWTMNIKKADISELNSNVKGKIYQPRENWMIRNPNTGFWLIWAYPGYDTAMDIIEYELTAINKPQTATLKNYDNYKSNLNGYWRSFFSHIVKSLFIVGCALEVWVRSFCCKSPHIRIHFTGILTLARVLGALEVWIDSMTAPDRHPQYVWLFATNGDKLKRWL